MEIKFQFRGNVYALCIGHKTKWFSQSPFVIFEQIWYEEDLSVGYAKIIFKI